MKVLDLRCAEDHAFEGWFASEDDFLAQCDSGALACPLCGNAVIRRLPSAPRLSISSSRRPDERPAGETPTPATNAVALQSQWLRAVRHMMASTEDVGERFPEEARRIHYGEVEERGIRGRASAEEAAALKEEGIEVMALPVPAALKGPLQ